VCDGVARQIGFIRQDPAVQCESVYPVLRQLVHADNSSTGTRRSSMVFLLKVLQI
jgi:hypothetical protein